jgi:hypothetical protein
VASCCECGDEPSSSCATELVSVRYNYYDTVNRALLSQQYAKM